MSILSPIQFREKHARNLKNATQDIIDGINRVDVSPTKLAVAKKAKMLQNITKAVNDGKWERGLNRVTLEEWKRKAADVGVNRIGPGIDAAAAEVESFATQFLPFVDNVAKTVRAMPDLTLQDNIQRMTKQITETAKFKRA